MTEVYRRIDKNHSDFLNTTTWLARTYARTVNPNKPMASLNESSSQSLNESLIELSRNFTLLMEDIEKECRDIGDCRFNQSNARDISGFYDDDDGIINYPSFASRSQMGLLFIPFVEHLNLQHWL